LTKLESELKLQLAIGYQNFLGGFKKADMFEIPKVFRPQGKL
jgi:hypothetical protein